MSTPKVKPSPHCKRLVTGSWPKTSRVGPPTTVINRHVPRIQAPHCGTDHTGLQDPKDTWTRDEDANFEPQERFSVSSETRAPTSNTSGRSPCGHTWHPRQMQIVPQSRSPHAIAALAGYADTSGKPEGAFYCLILLNC